VFGKDWANGTILHFITLLEIEVIMHDITSHLMSTTTFTPSVLQSVKMSFVSKKEKKGIERKWKYNITLYHLAVTESTAHSWQLVIKRCKMFK
jgi:hypothetical protein